MAGKVNKKAEIAMIVAYTAIMVAYGILVFHKLPSKKG
jgi:hypothetical protein